MTEIQRSDRDALVTILQEAYSGELAAALAYRGHWKSVRNPDQRRPEADSANRTGGMGAS